MPTASLMPASPTTEGGAERHRPHGGGHQVISPPVTSHGKLAGTIPELSVSPPAGL